MPPKIGRPRIPLYDRIDPYLCKDDNNPDACWLWTGGVDKNGYGRVKLPPDENGERRIQGIHRIMYERYIGPIPEDKPLIMHICDTPVCCNPKHLRAATPSENSADMVAKGRSKISSGAYKKGQTAGANNVKCKLTQADVDFIRAYPQKYGSQKFLANTYGVTRDTIFKILSNHIWKPAQGGTLTDLKV